MVDLRLAFEHAERSCPGVSDMFVKEILHKLVPGFSESRINTLVDKISRLVDSLNFILLAFLNIISYPQVE